jgi:hypothetical protein
MFIYVYTKMAGTPDVDLEELLHPNDEEESLCHWGHQKSCHCPSGNASEMGLPLPTPRAAPSVVPGYTVEHLSVSTKALVEIAVTAKVADEEDLDISTMEELKTACTNTVPASSMWQHL